MGAPVWVLSVDLQAKTATFQSGMADAARSARGSFGEISTGSNAMGKEVGGSMTEARHGVMMLGEEFGVHLPRGLTTFIASMGPVGAAMEAAFPFLAIILGATLLLEHLAKLREAGVKLTEDQAKFKIAVNDAFNSMDEKILQAEKRTDELKDDHLGALHAELKLIDMQSLSELASQFEKVAKAADVAFGQVAGHWYTFGIGSAGAKSALESFQSQYDLLLSQGKKDEAGGLLTGTLAQAVKVNDAMKQFKDNQADPTSGKKGNYAAAEQAAEVLRQAGLMSKVTGEFTENEAKSQQTLVEALQAQLHIQQQVATLNAADKGAAKADYNKKTGKDTDERAKLLAEAMQKGVDEEGRIIREANKQMETDIAGSWRNSIDATKQGSAERLAVIDQALAAEEARGMEDTGAYRSLSTERVNLVRQMAQEESKLKVDAAREAADQDEKMGMMALAAAKEHTTMMDSLRHVSSAQRVAEESEAADAEYAYKRTAIQKEIAALDDGAGDYDNKLQAILDRETQLHQQHEDAVTAIKEKATEARNATIMASENRALNSIANGLTQSIMGHETWSKMLNSFADEAATGMVKNSLMILMQQDKERLSNARTAATSAFATGEKIGGPAGVVLGPVFAAAAFAGAMAFHDGGIVPGVGRGDIVPAMLEPGEGVLPKQLMDRLSTSGGSAPVNHYSVHVAPTYHVNTIDGDGMSDALAKHTDVLQGHFESAVRRMNK